MAQEAKRARKWRPEITLEKLLQYSLPTIVTLGSAYWIGVLGVVRLEYLTLLSVETVLMTSLILAVPYALIVGMGVSFGWFRALGERDEVYPKSYFGFHLQDVAGHWIDNRVKRFLLISQMTLSLLFALMFMTAILPRASLAMYLMPWIALAYILVPGPLIGGLMAYYRDRYDGGRRGLFVAFSFYFVLLAINVGVMRTLQSERTDAEVTRISLSGDKTIEVSGLLRLGDRFVYFDRSDHIWHVVKSDELTSLSPLTTEDMKDGGAHP